MKKNIFAAIILLVVAMLVPIFAGAANSSAGYAFTDVDVNGVDMANNPTVYAERGELVYVKVDLQAAQNVKGVNVKTWIGGYEYDDVRAVTEMFDVEQGVTYPIVLAFKVPTDIDGSKEYTLHIEAYDKDNQYEQEYALRIKEKRHLIDIQDAIFNPGLTLKNSDPLFVVVRLKNMGDKEEKDIRVEASIPSLGLSQRTYVDKLTKTDTSDDENSESSDALYLDLSNVSPGTYKLRVTAEYNNGHDVVGKEYSLVVQEGRQSLSASSLIVGASQKSMTVSAGSDAVYKVSVANLADEPVALEAELAGVDSWANYKVEPALIVVPGSSKSDFVVTVSPNQEAQGRHQFVLTLKQAGKPVSQVAFEAVVQGGASNTMNSLKTGLEITFIILLVIAVVLAVVIGVQRISSRKEDEGFTSNGGDASSLAPEPSTYY